MNNRNIRAILSCLLVLCMLISSGAAAFADPAHIDADNNTIIDPNLGDLSTDATNSTALYVGADNNGSAVVTAGTVTATTTDDQAYGIITQAMDEGSSVNVTTGSISSTSSNSGATGVWSSFDSSGDITINVQGNIETTGKTSSFAVSTDASYGNTDITVNGSITAESKDKNSTAMGVYINYSEGTTNVTVDGGITAQSKAENGNAAGIMVENASQVDISVAGDVITTGDDYACGVSGDDIDTAVIQVDGNVISTSESTASGISFGNIENSITVTVGGNVSAEAEQFGAAAIDVAVMGGCEGTVTVEGSVTARSKEGSAYGMHTIDSLDCALNISTGDITSISQESDANGIIIEYGSDGNTSITVDGSVTAQSQGVNGVATGVGLEYTEGNKNITVNGDITALSQAEHGIATGIDMSSSTGVNISVTGNVEAAGSGFAGGISADDSSGTIRVNGSVSAKSEEAEAYGVVADAAGNGKMTVTVDGTVTADSDQGSATGVSAEASAGGRSIVSIGKEIAVSNLSTKLVDSATAIHANADTGGEVSITVESGGVSAVSEKCSVGVSASADTGSAITVDITGNVVSDSETACGILAYSSDGGNADITVHGNVEAVGNPDAAEGGYGILAAAYDGGSTTVTVDGDVSSETTGVHVLATDSTGSSTETVLVSIAGDLTGGETGILVNEGPDIDADINVVVVGTLHADESPVLVGKLVDNNDLNLTIWQIDIPDDGNIIEQYGGGKPAATEQTKEMEQNIHYIIKVDPPAVPAITLNGTFRSNGWETAKENEIVTLKPMPGYELLAAYNGLGVKIPLMTDKDGYYYLAVPRGGGVYLSVDYNYNEPFKAGPWWYGETAPVTVSFELDGGKIGEDEGPVVINTWIGNWIYLPEAPEKEGSTFLYWKELLPEENEEQEPLKYKAGQSWQVLGDTRFIAVWDTVETL